MIIEKVGKHIKCNWCHECNNGWEEMFVDIAVEGKSEAFYHLRCLGKMFVLRIEGVLPDRVFNATVQELNSSIVVQTSEEEE